VATSGTLVGRRAELDAVAELPPRLADGAAGLVLTGPAGMGKTTLWRHGIELVQQDGVRVLTAWPSEAESRLSFAGLSDLVAGIVEDAFAALPRLQRRALEIAALRRDRGRSAVDARTVGAALLSLLRRLAVESPVVLAVDDAQWLDGSTAGALAFALRRLEAEPVGILATARTDETRPRLFLDALPARRREEIRLGPLSVAAIHAILQNELGRVLPRPTLVRVVEESGGNPFYALEIARELLRLGLTATTDGLPIPAEVQALVRGRLARLPDATREALLLAACLGAPHISLVSEEALAPAEEADVVRLDADGRIRFAHPLLAAAVYEMAPRARRRAAHRRLAGEVDDLEERARHLALASTGPDPAIALELEEAARLAATRGATGSAAELGGLALRLTPPGDAGELLRRRTALGHALFAAGDSNAAIAALEDACREGPPGSALTQAMADLGTMYTSVAEFARGTALIDEAIARADDPVAAASAHARRAWVSQLEPDLVIEHCRAVLELPEEAAPDLHSFALQHLAYALLYTGREARHDLIARSLRGQRSADQWTISSIAARWPMFFDDFETARLRHLDLIAYSEETGHEPERQTELAYLGLIELWAGRPEPAEASAREALDLADQIEQQPMACVSRYVLGLIAAHRGRLDEAEALARESLVWIGTGWPDEYFILATQAHAVLGFVELCRGDLEAADAHLTLADEASARWAEPVPFRFHGDQVEAAVALGDLDGAERLVARLESRARAIPRPWISGIAARGRALLLAARGELDGALTALEEALAHQAPPTMPFERARTLLELGRLHRRRKEKRLARLALEEAEAVFAAVGAPLFVEAARRELARVATRKAARGLTATEEQIARLAAEGLTNRRIAERSFVSVHTVEANLGRVYRKLGISSRAQLARALDELRRQPIS
jgi:DNA-binding CsgD family transcriptional regulator